VVMNPFEPFRLWDGIRWEFEQVYARLKCMPRESEGPGKSAMALVLGFLVLGSREAVCSVALNLGLQ
jgi:hypothetical protein